MRKNLNVSCVSILLENRNRSANLGVLTRELVVRLGEIMNSKTFLTMVACSLLAIESHAQERNAELAKQAMAILQSRCYRCHGGTSTSAGLNVLSADSLFGARGTEEATHAFVVKGASDKSLLWEAVESKFMPLDDSDEANAMTDDERATLKKWIDAGADFPLREITKVIDNEVSFRAVLKYLYKKPFEDRNQYRFLSLANLHNNADVSLQDLRYSRAALAKVLNSLIFKKRATIDLEAVPDTEEAIFAIDLRNLDWDRNQNWQFILDHYPYGVQFEFSENRSLRDAYNEVRQKSGTEQPILRADWFIVYATQHPLYTRLMELPDTLDGLEQRLGVDFEANIRNAKIMRAGFARSGVSQQNRLIERHEGNNGYVWISYDFKPRRARSDLARFPLGPKFAGNPFGKNAFEHDGGELIFRLPNGLQGYMLVLADGKRLDGPAPADIVFDASGVTGSTAILNGISCMNCHARGMIIGFRDDVRDSHAVGGPAQAFLEKIYPEHDRMSSAIEADRDSYVQTENKLIGKYLQKEDSGEPVGKVALRYFTNVDVRSAALELGLSDPKALQTAIATNRDLSGLGLGRFTQQPPSSIQRVVWESVEQLSYWQEIVTLVQPGAMPIAPKSSNSKK